MATFNNGESGLSVRTKINNVLQHADGTASELVINEAGADVNFRVESDTDPNALFVDGGTGNVGIGTSSPQGYANYTGITIQDTTGGFLTARNAANTHRVELGVNGSTGFGYLATFTATGIQFLTNSTERMRITSTGNVLVNTTTTAGSSAPLVSKGGVTIVDAAATPRGVSQEIVTGASGTFTTVTVSFDGNNPSGSLIVEILMTGFSGVYLDYVAGIYSNQADVVMRDNSNAGTSVALTGSAGSSWTATITTNVTHPVVKVKATAGGLSSGFVNAPTVAFA